MERLNRDRFLNCWLTSIVTAFRTDPVVLHGRIAIGAICQRRSSSIV